MNGLDRARAYARQNGQDPGREIQLTPRQIRRYLKKQRTAAPGAPDVLWDEVHTCNPGAQLYYCPTAREVESDCHGGFDVCCSRPDLHVPYTPDPEGADDAPLP